MSERRCRCGTWYDAKLRACPECGREVRVNVALASERWRDNLRAQAHHAKQYG